MPKRTPRKLVHMQVDDVTRAIHAALAEQRHRRISQRTKNGLAAGDRIRKNSCRTVAG
jgi:hypothetical protein